MLHDIEVKVDPLSQVHPTCKLTNETDGMVCSKASLVTHTHTLNSGPGARFSGSVACLRRVFDGGVLLFHKVKFFKAFRQLSTGRGSCSCQRTLCFCFYTRRETGQSLSQKNGLRHKVKDVILFFSLSYSV